MAMENGEWKMENFLSVEKSACPLAIAAPYADMKAKMKPYRTVQKSVIFQNPWWTYCLDQIELPSGRLGEFHYVLTQGSSMVVPIDAQGRLVLVKQYRYTGKRESIEFPCGGLKEGASHEQAARDELVEEAGFSAGRLVDVGSFNPCNGLLDEICRVYIAGDLQYVGARPDETEGFELIRLTEAEVKGFIRDGIIWDGMTLAAWAIAGPEIQKFGD
jgi:ADP-ribose pyrophosphatase